MLHPDISMYYNRKTQLPYTQSYDVMCKKQWYRSLHMPAYTVSPLQSLIDSADIIGFPVGMKFTGAFLVIILVIKGKQKFINCFSNNF